jgi:hypothetical protein
MREMRTNPDLQEIVFGDRGMVRGIEACVRQQCLVSAVALIYSSIDTIAALARNDPSADTTSKEFVQWLEAYFLPSADLPCSAIDLYGARCGILHTYSQDSRKRREGKAKALVYCWRSGPAADAEIPLPPDAVVIVIEDLIEAFRHAVIRFVESCSQRPELARLVDVNLRELLCYRPCEPVTIYVAA